MIITLGTDVNGGETVVFNGMAIWDISKKLHVIKHSHGRCVVGAFDSFCTKDLFGLGTELYYILSYTNISFSAFYIMVQSSMTDITYDDINIYINDDGNGVRPNQSLRTVCNSKISGHIW